MGMLARFISDITKQVWMKLVVKVLVR